MGFLADLVASGALQIELPEEQKVQTPEVEEPKGVSIDFPTDIKFVYKDECKVFHIFDKAYAVGNAEYIQTWDCSTYDRIKYTLDIEFTRVWSKWLSAAITYRVQNKITDEQLKEIFSIYLKTFVNLTMEFDPWNNCFYDHIKADPITIAMTMYAPPALNDYLSKEDKVPSILSGLIFDNERNIYTA